MSKINGHDHLHNEGYSWLYYETADGIDGLWVYNPADQKTPVSINRYNKVYKRFNNATLFRPYYKPKPKDLIWVNNSTTNKMVLTTFEEVNRPGIESTVFQIELREEWQTDKVADSILDANTGEIPIKIDKLIITDHPQDLVKNFLSAAGKQLPTIEDAPLIHEDVRILIIKLILEELTELVHAMNSLPVAKRFRDMCYNIDMVLYDMNTRNPIKDTNHSIVEQLDALCDLEYVLHNGTLLLGFKDIFKQGFSEVHGSNMSKFVDIDDNQQIDDTIQYYAEKYGLEVTISENGAVLREDGKILKAVGYWKPNLAEIIWPLTDNNES